MLNAFWNMHPLTNILAQLGAIISAYNTPETI